MSVAGAQAGLSGLGTGATLTCDFTATLHTVFSTLTSGPSRQTKGSKLAKVVSLKWELCARGL